VETKHKIVSTNRKARHDYEILDTYEAGLVLMGSEIKSIRAGHVNLREGFVQARDNELWLLNVHIAAYDQAGVFGHDPLRPRKLLLHRKEINRIMARVQEKGLARGKKQYDKREALRKQDSKRQIERAMREQYK
jgi:SsrA-binding protein